MNMGTLFTNILSRPAYNGPEGVVFLDGISLLDASLFYSLLFSPLLTMVFLLFWISAEIKKSAMAQILGIVILMAAGIFAINSPFITFIEAIAILLLVVWFIAHKDSFRREKRAATLSIFAFQITYYILFFPLLISGNAATAFVLCIAPILSVKFAYPWVFGRKAVKGRVYVIFAFIVQVILILLNTWFALKIL